MLRLLLPLIILSACSVPTPEMRGSEPSRHEVAGYIFEVNHSRSRAEAYRKNVAWRPDQSEVFERAAQAMEQASGCKAVRGSLAGDIARVTADLICGGRSLQ